jgi:hypothetical protein
MRVCSNPPDKYSPLRGEISIVVNNRTIPNNKQLHCCFYSLIIRDIFWETMIENNDSDLLEEVVSKAHRICDRILLCEAVEMKDDEVRLFLSCNCVSGNETQDAYLDLVRKYDAITSNGYLRQN